MLTEPGLDLVSDPWIPVVVKGAPALWSLRHCLLDAHMVELATDSPLEAVAVFRQVLLPVYLDATFAERGHAPPRDEDGWAELWHRGRLDAACIEDYLGRYADRFRLFGSRPFAQVAGLRTTKDETKPASLLIASAASGNNVPLFSARTEAEPPALTPDRAARALLATHCWDTAGIKSGAEGDSVASGGKTTGNMTGPLGSLGVVLPLGRNLAETLLLHTPYQPQPFPRGDRPQWRVEPDDPDYPGRPSWSRRPALGLLDLLTWQARRVRLIPERDGDRGLVVRRVVLAAGDRLDPIPQHHEPHTAWKLSPRTKAPVPVRHVAGRAAWRGLGPLLTTVPDPASGQSTTVLLERIAALRAADCLPVDQPLQILAVGVQYGTQSAVVEDLIADQIPLPLVALQTTHPVRRLLDTIIDHAERLRRAANQLGDELREASGGDKLPWDRGQRLGDALMYLFTPDVRRILAGLQREPDRVEEADDAWRSRARRLALDAAEPALAAVPPKAFLGRQVSQKDQKYRRCDSVAEVRYHAEINRILGPPDPANGGAPDTTGPGGM